MRKLVTIMATILLAAPAFADEIARLVNANLLKSDAPLAAYIDQTEKQIEGKCEIKERLTYAYPLEESLFASAEYGFTVHFQCLSASRSEFTILVKGEIIGTNSIKSTRISLLP